MIDRVLVQKIVYLLADRAQTFRHRKLAVQLECGGFNDLRRVVLAVVEDGKAAATQARVYPENAPTELLAKRHASRPAFFGLVPTSSDVCRPEFTCRFIAHGVK